MNKFGGWAIQESCFNFIREILPEGKTILEFGSGYGTDFLSKYYNMVSIENQKEWVGRYNSHYLNVPVREYVQEVIKTKGLFGYDNKDSYTPPDLPGEGSKYQKGWYDFEILEKKLEGLKYDLILVDGPNGAIGRGGFLKHINLFNTDIPIIFDDINREPENQLMIKVSEELNKPYKTLDKHTGYIL